MKFNFVRPAITLLFSIGLCIALTTTASPFGSGEKSPEEKAAENEKKATKEYNNGVKHMGKAREKALKGDSTYAFNYRATSDAKAKKEYEKAVKNFNKALKYKPDMPEAYNNLGYCYRKLDKLDESLKAYFKALEIDSIFAQAREYLGETYLALDSLEQALTQLEILQQLESPYADTLSRSIEIFKLEQINEKLENTNK